MRLEVFGVGYEVGRVDYLVEGACREVASLLSLEVDEVLAGGVVGLVFGADVGVNPGNLLGRVSG